MDMTFTNFMTALLILSILTGLFTEAVKNYAKAKGKKVNAILLTGRVSLVLTVLACIGFIVFYSINITGQVIVVGITLIIFSWLCAMVGYDKVIEGFKKIK